MYRTRLLQIKGVRTIRCHEVECETGSLNTGDVFLLDMGLKLYIYKGEHASKVAARWRGGRFQVGWGGLV